MFFFRRKISEKSICELKNIYKSFLSMSPYNENKYVEATLLITNFINILKKYNNKEAILTWKLLCIAQQKLNFFEKNDGKMCSNGYTNALNRMKNYIALPTGRSVSLRPRIRRVFCSISVKKITNLF